MLEKIVVRHRRLFNEISVVWNALHENPEQPELAQFLVKMLKAASEEKKRFCDYWDVNVNAAIDTVKLVKRGKQH